MGIILVKGPDPKEPGKGAAQFVPVDKADFPGPQRQVPVGVGPGFVQQHTAGAVHGFDGILFVIDYAGVHVLPVVIPVAALFPQLPVQKQRGFGLHVPGPLVLGAPVGQKGVPQLHASCVEKRHSCGLVMKTVKIEVCPEFSVVPLFGLLDKVQVLFQLFFVKESGSVKPLELGAVLVGPPVGPGVLHELETADKTGVRHMGTPAKIDERSLLVQGNLPVFELFDQLDFVGIVFEKFNGFFFGYHHSLKRLFGFDDFFHFRFNGWEVVLGNRWHIDVVVKSVLYHRTDGKKGVFIQVLHRFGHDVGRAVPQDFKGFLVIDRNEPELCIPVDHRIHIEKGAVEGHGHAVSCKTFGYAACHIDSLDLFFK